MSRPPQREHLVFLSRPGMVRRLWIIFGVVLAAAVAAETLAHMHAAFALAELFGFNAAYGLLSCAAIVLISKGLSVLLKRPDTYYEGDEDRS